MALIDGRLDAETRLRAPSKLNRRSSCPVAFHTRGHRRPAARRRARRSGGGVAACPHRLRLLRRLSASRNRLLAGDFLVYRGDLDGECAMVAQLRYRVDRAIGRLVRKSSREIELPIMQNSIVAYPRHPLCRLRMRRGAVCAFARHLTINEPSATPSSASSTTARSERTRPTWHLYGQGAPATEDNHVAARLVAHDSTNQ